MAYKPRERGRDKEIEREKEKRRKNAGEAMKELVCVNTIQYLSEPLSSR